MLHRLCDGRWIVERTGNDQGDRRMQCAESGQDRRAKLATRDDEAEPCGTRIGGDLFTYLARQRAVHGNDSVRVRTENQQVPLWAVSTSGSAGDLDRSVVAGEAHGRWLWIVLRPASAILLFRDDLILRDVSTLGPPLLETPFGGPAPLW